ncbi:hypothetical protein HDU67_001606 [Dinochytrium kinnereticum]|nr:hypothetical protein HDU67_001606 [Dinochytrium kinnereticum]
MMDEVEEDSEPPTLPLEVLMRVIAFCKTKHLRTLLLVSRSFFSMAAAEWNSRLPKLLPNTVLHGTALYHSLGGSQNWGKVNVFARVLKLGAKTYSTAMAQIEFLGKHITSKELRSGGLGAIREIPDTGKLGIKTDLGRRIWVFRSMDGGVTFRVQTSGFLIYNEPVTRSKLHLKVWSGEEMEEMVPPVPVGTMAMASRSKMRITASGDAFRNAMIASLVSRRGSLPHCWGATASAGQGHSVLLQRSQQGMHSFSRSKQMVLAPGIPWPSTPDILINLEALSEAQHLGHPTIRKGIDVAAAADLTRDSATKPEGIPLKPQPEGESYSDAYFGIIPSAISAICLAIIFASFSSDMGTDSVINVVVLEDDSTEDSLIKDERMGSEKPVTSLRKQVQEQLSPERINKVLGLTLAALKISLLSMRPETGSSKLHFEEDPHLVDLLNKTYPPLLSTLSEAGSSFEAVEVADFPSTRFFEEKQLSNAELAGEKELNQEEDIDLPLIGKSVISGALDFVCHSSQSVVLLVSRWLSAASLVRMMLPASVQRELEFLGHYLTYCIEAETALNLPLLFPSDFETDRSGAVVKINTPMSVFILRALARAAAGVAITLLPFFRRKVTLRRTRPVPKTRSFDMLVESKESPNTLKLTDTESGQIEQSIKISLLSKARHHSDVSGSISQQPTPVVPKLQVTAASRQEHLNPDSTLKPSHTKEIPIPKVGERHLDVATSALRKMSFDSKSFLRNNSMESLYSRSFGSDADSRLSTSPMGEEWESFRIREAGIPIEILKLEFEAIRAGNNVDSSLLVSENNDLEPW